MNCNSNECIRSGSFSRLSTFRSSTCTRFVSVCRPMLPSCDGRPLAPRVPADDGNNGGDGFVVARTLMQRGVSVSVFLMGRVADVRGDARVNLEILGRLGVTVVEIGDGQAWELHFSEVRDCSIIVDAIFGTGLNAPVSGLIESVIADVNAAGITVVSIDVPSGLSADSAEPIGDSVEADTTVTLGVPKLPLVLAPGENRAGDIVIADIGIPTGVIDALDGPWVELLTRASMRDLIT